MELVGIESPGLSSAPAIACEVASILRELGLALPENPAFDPHRAGIPKFRELSTEERQALIEQDPLYGHIICRCETVTEGEIVGRSTRTARPRPRRVKRRTRTGMGRCSGGFCTPQAVEIIARELGIDPTAVTKCGGESYLLVKETKNE